MKYLSNFKLFESSSKETIINSIIDDEINKSKGFGLEIEESDIQKEKKIFSEIFTKYWNSIKNSDNNSYNSLRREIASKIYDIFDDRLRYYFNKSNKGGVRNMYNCHIDNVISMLFITISNDLR